MYDNDYFDLRQLVRDVKKEVALPKANAYIKNNTHPTFAQMTNDFSPENKQELLNIYYTVVNSGWDNFVFYCDYGNCIEDVNNISSDTILLSNINSFVHTYNQYSTINTYTTPLLNSKVSIFVTRTYDDFTIEKIDKRMNTLYNELNLSNLEVKDQILTVHDFIISNTEYDTFKIEDIHDKTYNSSTAYGLLFEGYAVCSGYADVMALFLDRMGIQNMKVASETHVWNLVYFDNKWHHLDLTWDDPYSPDGRDVLYYKFFLIDYQELKAQDPNGIEHIFDESIYKNAL